MTAKTTVFRLVRRALRLREGSVQVEGLRVAYMEAGQGPPLVLLHGLGTDKDTFIKVASALARRHRLILPDLPGFGDSDRPADISYAVPDQVRRVRAFTRALGLERFTLGGNSMGGFIAGAYAAAYPEDVTALWLLAPAGVNRAAPSELATCIAAGESPPILARTHDEFRDVLRFVMAKPQRIPRFMMRALADEQIARYDHHCRVIDHLIEGTGLDDMFEANPLDVPTLVVWGEEDRALHVSGADVLGALLPRVEVRRMVGVGHMPQLEAPRAVLRDYFTFQSGLAEG